MGWFLFAIVCFYFWQRYQKEAIEFERRGETIGQEIKKDGYIYLNIGDLENNENWILAGKYEPFYYVNIYEKDGNYEIRIEESHRLESIESIQCEAERETYMTVNFYKNIYSKYGTVVIDDEQMECLKEIMKTDPYFKKHYNSYKDNN
ncbi:hypothetical protein J2S74_005304 [Evansella vedderi]|uniref:WYL domain-containing protein n=1 Tax=Evansella vedderi TaxID=38282 RepID=A0ABU0A2X3_9BACI|nr:hypothetical protein [Evansella vedderi]MDQ0257841.1 hypothetical protein [Evansella vedderi]